MTGVELIAEERRRQVETEGWTAEHDDSHKGGDLALAAACYAIPMAARTGKANGSTATVTFDILRFLWPWWNYNDPDARAPRREMAWWKPSPANPEGRVRDLVKAGALIAAEIDRLQRSGLTQNEDPIE